MKCPLCGKEMITGDMIFKRPWPGAIYPQKKEDSPAKHTMKLLFGSKDAIAFSGEGEGWYCEDCNKVVAVLDAKEK